LGKNHIAFEKIKSVEVKLYELFNFSPQDFLMEKILQFSSWLTLCYPRHYLNQPSRYLGKNVVRYVYFVVRYFVLSQIV